MFDQTFVDGVGKTNKGWTVAVSFTLEFLAVGVMILIPLIWSGVLPKASLVDMLTAPAPPPRPAPPPQPVERAVKVVRRVLDGRALQAPTTIPRQVVILNDAPPAPLGTGVSGGLELGGSIGGTGALGPGIGPAPVAQAVTPPPVKEPPKKQEGPYRQSSGVQAARCVNCPKPVYPAILRQARIQGTVVLSAIIAKDGTVQRLTVVSPANPLLTSAAMDAVKKWVYIPTILNDEPIEVVTEITVNFALQ